MTVEASDTIERQVISGVGPYPFSFRIFNATDLAVSACSTDTPPVPVPLTYLTHYTVADVNDAEGGSVTLTSDAATAYAGYTLDVRSNTPVVQPASIRNTGRFLPEIHEDEFDRVTRQVQDLSRKVSASFRYPDNVLSDGVMSSIANWTSKYLFVGTTGLIEPASNIGSVALTSSLIGTTLESLVRTAAEIAAGVTPVNYAYAPGNALRYGTNTTPGTTPMHAAIQAAINVAGTGENRGRAYIPAGAYLITESLVPGTAGAGVFVQIEICGDGPSTQIINACSANKPSFVGSGVCRWKVRDLAFTGNTSHPNHGVMLDGAVGLVILWELERVICAMPGIGFYLKDTNSGTIRNCKSWPSGENFQIAPTITSAAIIDHHIFMTGGYVHDVTIIDFEGLPLSTYKVGQAGLRCNAADALTIRVIGGVWQCDNNTRFAFNCSNLAQFAFMAPYCENALTNFDDCQGGVFNGMTAGNIGGSLTVTGGSLDNTFIAVQMGVLVVDATSTANAFIGCSFGTSFTDNAVPLNRYINCLLAGFSTRLTDAGAQKRLRVAQASGGTKTPDAANVDVYQLNVTDTAAFTIGAPSNPFDGKRLDINIRNASGGAMGAITWPTASMKMSAWTNPANGTNRTVSFVYDSASALWYQICATGTDITN